MAKSHFKAPGPPMTTGELVGGFLYLPFYIVLLAAGLGHLNNLLGLGLTSLHINILYFAINTLMILLIFRKFLLQSFRSIRFWELVQAIILGGALYYAGNFVVNLLITLLELNITNFNNNTVMDLAEQGMTSIVICSVILAPIVEETLVRGLLFGTICRRSRIAAYVVTIVFFAFLHVWQYLLTAEPIEVLKASIVYIPAGIGLGWTYEKSGNIWAPIFLHMISNAVSFGILQLLQLV